MERNYIMKENYFDTVAKEWNTPQRQNTNEDIKEIILDGFEENSHSEIRALEIGAGDGMLAMLLSKHFNKIDCVDSSEGMREECLRNKEKFSADNIFVCDESFLENTTEKYNLIYSHKAFHHIVAVEAELKLLKEVVATGGKLYLIDFCTIPSEFHKDFPNFDGHDGFSKEEIHTYFENTGWKLTNYEIIRYGKKDDIEYEVFLAVGEPK